MRRTVYNSPNNPDDNQYSNSNDGTGGLPISQSDDGTGGLPEGWRRSTSPSDNPSPRLTTEEILEQQRIENQIRENNRRRRLEPSNGQAGGTEQQWGDPAGAFSRAVKQRTDLTGVNGGGGNPDDIGFAGARGNQTIAEQIRSHVPLSEIIPPQINNQINNTDDAPPEGVDQPNTLLPPRFEQPLRPIARPRENPNWQGVGNYFGLRFQELEPLTPEQQQALTQQNVQQTPEQQAGEQRRKEAQQRIFEAQQRIFEAQQRVAEAQQRVAEAQQRALDLQIELALLNQDASPRTADLPTPAPQITAAETQRQSRETTPETVPIRPRGDASKFSGTQPSGGRGD